MNRIIFLTVLSICFCNSMFAQDSKIVEQELDQIFQEFDNSKTPGLAIGFLKDGQLQFSKSYGMADLEHQIPVTDTSVFSLASVSKQFTAFALLLLEERGQLSLEDDIRKYLPELKDYGPKITIKMLANHTSGLRGHLSLLGLTGFVPDNVITSGTVREIIYWQEELNFKPGSQFSYSNSGYFLMAEIVEKISGQSFATFMQEEVFQPLGMDDSFVMDDFHRIVENRAPSYALWGESYVNSPANYSYYGSTNLYTTLQDLSKWTLNFEQAKVGSPALFDKMNTLGKLNNGASIGYALGQFKSEFNGLLYISHSGADAGYRAFLGRFPEQSAALLLLSNNGTVYAEGKALEAADLFLKSFYPKKSITAASSSKNNVIRKLKPAQLKKWAGAYISPDNYLVRTITLKDDTLILSRPEQGNRTSFLLPVNANTFQIGENAEVILKFSEGVRPSFQVLQKDKVIEKYQLQEPVNYSNAALKLFTGQFYSKELDTEYKIEIEEGKLFVKHPKMWPIELNPIEKDVFLSQSWRFRSLVFERNNQGVITGFRVSTDRAENVRFVNKKSQ